jgi:hypothetical protein
MPEPGAVGPVPLFFPPFPNEEKMRRGRLNVERPLGGLGENRSVRGEWFFNNERILLVVWFDLVLCFITGFYSQISSLFLSEFRFLRIISFLSVPLN